MILCSGGWLVAEQLVTRLVPVLAMKPQEEFNVFNVMRYGGHEKQLSDVFAWLLDAGGTHKLGDSFLRIFIDEVNRGLRVSSRLVTVPTVCARGEHC